MILFVHVRGTTQRNARCTLTVRRDLKLSGKSKQATVQRFFFFLLNFNSRKRKIRQKIRDQKDFCKNLIYDSSGITYDSQMKEEVLTKSDVDLFTANSLFMDFAGVVFCSCKFSLVYETPSHCLSWF